MQGVQKKFSQGVKWQEREADHPPPTSAEVKDTWIYTSIPHTSQYRSAQLVKHKDNLIFFKFDISKWSAFPFWFSAAAYSEYLQLLST
jgi:hypothetical protein